MFVGDHKEGVTPSPERITGFALLAEPIRELIAWVFAELTGFQLRISGTVGSTSNHPGTNSPCF